MAITKTMHMKASGKGKIDIHLEHAYPPIKLII
jgi:hypothetical protein